MWVILRASSLLAVGVRCVSGTQRTRLLRWDGFVRLRAEIAAERPRASCRPGRIRADQPADIRQASQRPPGADEVTVGVGPVAANATTGDEDVVDVQVAVDEHRCPRLERYLGEPLIACDHLEGQWSSRSIKREELEEWAQLFEPPTEDEYLTYDCYE